MQGGRPVSHLTSLESCILDGTSAVDLIFQMAFRRDSLYPLRGSGFCQAKVAKCIPVRILQPKKALSVFVFFMFPNVPILQMWKLRL